LPVDEKVEEEEEEERSEAGDGGTIPSPSSAGKVISNRSIAFDI
jgi:hypothetical protein